MDDISQDKDYQSLMESWDWNSETRDIGEKKRAVIGFQCPPSWVRLFDRMLTEGIATKTKPWITKSDVVRAIILCGLKHLPYEIGNAQEWIAKRDIDMRVQDAQERAKQSQTLFESIRLQAHEMQKVGAGEHAAMMVRQTVKDIKKLDPHWTTVRFLDQVDKEFRSLLDAYPQKSAALGRRK